MFLSIILCSSIYGQSTVSSRIPQKMSGHINKDVIADHAIYIYELTITSETPIIINAKDSVVIGPGFIAGEGTNVIIEATDSNIQLQDDLSDDAITSVTETKEIAEIESIKLYSLTSFIVYFSTTDFDIQSKHFADGIYILEKTYSDESIKREKVVLENN